MTVFINPGAGPITDATEEHAQTNIRHFVADLSISDAEVYRAPQHDDNGRFAFLIAVNGRYTIVEMPGLSLEKVRWVQPLNPWHFPRLYVDGSSWLWAYALDMALHALSGKDSEEYDET